MNPGSTAPIRRATYRIPFRNVLALLMLLAASLGAATAFWTARTELMVSKLERQLTLGRMTEVLLRHEASNRISLRSILEERRRDRAAAADQYDTLRANATGSAKHEFALLAQKADAQALFEETQRYAMLAGQTDATETGLRHEMDEWVLRSLMERGLTPATEIDAAKTDSDCGESAATHEGDAPPTVAAPATQPAGKDADAKLLESRAVSWSKLESGIHARRERVLQLSLLTTLFIGALLCMTLSHVTRRQSWSSLYLASGALLTVGTAVRVTLVDPSFLVLLTGVIAAWSFVAVAVWALSRGREAPEAHEPAEPPAADPAEFKGASMVLREAHGAHATRTIVLVAVTALLSGLDGYLFTRAQHHADEASEKAFASEAEFNARAALGAAADAGGVASAARLLKARLECDSASQMAVWSTPQGDASYSRRRTYGKRVTSSSSPR
jgi:hypothetical protein